MPTDVAELYAGILSDSPEKLSYMEGVGVNYSAVKIRTFPMQADKLPDHVIGLDLLDVLVITDYDTRKLSKDQISAIMEWVKDGGTLLLEPAHVQMIPCMRSGRICLMKITKFLQKNRWTWEWSMPPMVLEIPL